MKFLLTLFVVFSIFSLTSYLIFQNNQTTPSETVIEVAKILPKYPNANSWEIDTGKKFCIALLFECGKSVAIIFTTKDSWYYMYNYYRIQMGYYKWETKSQVYTSTPGSIIFTKQNCQSELAPKYKFNSDEIEYFTFVVNCNAK